MKPIEYRAGYKYQLTSDGNDAETGIIPAHRIETEYINLNLAGLITVKHGYAWDGPSGPTIDTKNFMRGSLFHDALYQLLREGHLAHAQRPAVDLLLKKLCLEDGMSKLRAWYVWKGVEDGANSASLAAAIKPILKAP